MNVSGRDVMDVLDDDEFWYDREGRRHRITQMDDEYIENVIEWLSRRAVSLAWMYAGHPSWWGAPDDVYEAALNATEDPHAWLETTKLMCALRAELRLRRALRRPTLADILERVWRSFMPGG